MRPRRYLAPALMACASVTAPHAAELTIDRLFDPPSLAGPVLSGLQLSPDGSRVTYLKGKPDQKDRLDLWEYNLQDGGSRILVDSAALTSGKDKLSDEELNRRERQRTAALTGIVEYSFASSGQAILFPVDGKLFYYYLSRRAENPLLQIAHSPGFATDATISPRGRYVAYIVDQNLYAYDIAARQENRLTVDGAGPIKNGMAEFVAQEEMGRSTGYWWSPDDARIAFTRIDETPVKVTQRFEISADNVASFAQRYPEAGGANVSLRLGVVDVHTGATRWMDLGSDEDFYLARVNWLPDGKTLAIQRESRDQRRLDLLFADTATGKSRLVLTETSQSWIELNDEITFLKRSPTFIWASMRDGFEHLYLYDYSGRLLHRITAGNWNVDDFRARAIKGVDERHQLVYFTATEKTPLERHLYSAPLNSEVPGQLKRISSADGVHDITMTPNAKVYVDTLTSTMQPPQTAIRSVNGALIGYLQENRLDAQHPDAPYVSDNSIPEFGELTAVDGQILHYRLFKPSHFDPKKHYPAVVDVYGGPGVQRVLNNWNGGSFTQILTRAGFVVFQLDNRGSAFRGTAFQAPIQRRLGEIEVADQVLGARWLASQPFVDSHRIGVWGWSYGGYMTLLLMFKAPDIFRAGVSGAPVTDWTLYDTHYTERYLGTPQANPQGYEMSSALAYAKNLTGNLLVIHGMADDNVLFLNSTKLFRVLQDLNKPFDVMVYPGAKHGLLRQPDGRHAYSMILNFFKDKLKE